MSSLYNVVLSERFKTQSERVILIVAIISFIAHLALIFINQLGFLGNNNDLELLKGPIAAVYTPFSFILIYEVYLLVYYLPKSITTYIGKQYEIITLILIRRLFKDLSVLELSSSWFEIKSDLQFTYDIIASLALFGLILIFNRLSQLKTGASYTMPSSKKVTRFVEIKKAIAGILVPVLLILSAYRLIEWITNYMSAAADATSLKDINNIFFDEFFTILIMIDVLLLLFSFIHTDKFHKVIRNSGFIISTILIRVSFGVDGLINTALILLAVLFGVLILWIHNKYEDSATAISEIPEDG